MSKNLEQQAQKGDCSFDFFYANLIQWEANGKLRNAWKCVFKSVHAIDLLLEKFFPDGSFYPNYVKYNLTIIFPDLNKSFKLSLTKQRFQPVYCSYGMSY